MPFKLLFWLIENFQQFHYYFSFTLLSWGKCNRWKQVQACFSVHILELSRWNLFLLICIKSNSTSKDLDFLIVSDNQYPIDFDLMIISSQSRWFTCLKYMYVYFRSDMTHLKWENPSGKKIRSLAWKVIVEKWKTCVEKHLTDLVEFEVFVSWDNMTE